MTHKKSKIFTLLGLLLVLVSPAQALEIPAIYIPTPGTWSYTSTTTGECIDGLGLGCTYSTGDALIDPLTDDPILPPPEQPLDEPEYVRAAVYTATGVGTDPGALITVAKAEPGGKGGDGTNPDNGFTLYLEDGSLLDPLLTDIEISRGFWSYEGEETLEYLTVKTSSRAFVWDINGLILQGDNDGDSSTPLIGYWELDSWYYPDEPKAMSHVSIFKGTKAPPQEVPAPPTLLLFGSLFGLIAWKKRRS